jgi:hypothetical protein
VKHSWKLRWIITMVLRSATTAACGLPSSLSSDTKELEAADGDMRASTCSPSLIDPAGFHSLRGQSIRNSAIQSQLTSSPLAIASIGAAVRAAQHSRDNRNDVPPDSEPLEATQVPESDVPVQATLVVESADHYTEWLDIPPGERPPNHYVLLGLDLYESDTEIIRQAADTQMKRIRPRCFKHPEKGTAILNEIAKARVCLIDQDRKNQYDQFLRHGPPKSAPQEAPSSSDSGTIVDDPALPTLSEESPMDYVPTAVSRGFRLGGFAWPSNCASPAIKRAHHPLDRTRRAPLGRSVGNAEVDCRYV